MGGYCVRNQAYNVTVEGKNMAKLVGQQIQKQKSITIVGITSEDQKILEKERRLEDDDREFSELMKALQMYIFKPPSKNN